MISFIVPTTDQAQILSLRTSLDKLGVPFEIIDIQGATSFFDCWRKALKKAKGDYLVLTHQDTEYFYLPDFTKIFTNKVGLCGVAGCKNYNTNNAWWFSQDRLRMGELSGQIYHDSPESKGLSFFGDYSGVDILDGVCLVTTPKLLKEILKDIKVDVTWDWYDHVLSTAFKLKGYKIKTIPLLMSHGSAGGSRRNTFEIERRSYLNWYERQTNTKKAQ
jgi:hypothetical protein